MNLFHAAFQAILSASWRTSLVILALVVLRLLVRGRIPAQLWFVAWLVIAVRLLVPVTVPAAWSPFNLGKVVSRVSIPASTLVSTVADGAAPSLAKSLPRDLPPAPAQVLAAPPRPHFQVDLIWLWPLGAAALLVARLLTWHAFRRRLQATRQPANERLSAMVSRCGSALGMTRNPGVFEAAAVDGPALFGIFRPRLLFPPGLAAALSDGELRLVVLHELGHWRRRDLLSQALIQGACVLHWFNPVIWLATRLARQDCEFACDEFVVRRTSSRETQDYGGALLKVLGVMRSAPRPAPLLGILENRAQLKRRLQMIVGYKNPSISRAIVGMALLILLGAVCLTRETRAQSPVSAPLPSATRTSSISSDSAAEETNPELRILLLRVAKLKQRLKANPGQSIPEMRYLREENWISEAGYATRLETTGDFMYPLARLRSAASRNFIGLTLQALEAYVKASGGRLPTDILALAPFADPPLDRAALQRYLLLQTGLLADVPKSAMLIEVNPDLLVDKVRDSVIQVGIHTSSTTDGLHFAEESAKAAFRAANHGQESQDPHQLLPYFKDSDLAKAYLDYVAILSNQAAKEEPTVGPSSADETAQSAAVAEAIKARRKIREQAENPASPANASPTAGSVVIKGQVVSPGVYELDSRSNLLTAVDLVERAGGFTDIADGKVQIVRHQGIMAIVNYADVGAVFKGKAQLTRIFLLEPGDVVTVRSEQEVQAGRQSVRRVSIQGAVRNPGAYELPADSTLSVVELITKAGGFTDIANGGEVRITHARPDVAGNVQRVDVLGIVKGTSSLKPDDKSLMLQPGDIVYVPEKLI